METEKSRRFTLKKIFWLLLFFGFLVLLISVLLFLFTEKDIDELLGSYPANASTYSLNIDNESAPKPNVIVIYCDDLGYGDIGCYGNEIIRTPNIDSLAKNGIRFTEYYASNALCAPSRAGLLTGRYPMRSGILGNTYPEDEPLGRRASRKFGALTKSLGMIDLNEDYVARGLPQEEITLAEALKTAGYRTGMIGKWHLGDYSKQATFNPIQHGFDEYFGVPYSNDMSPYPLYRNETELEADIGQDEDQAKLTGLYTKEAIQFIEKSKEYPFLLYFAHTFPHQPLYASEGFDKQSKAGKYGDAVEEIDWSVGELLKCLERNQLDSNTIIIFTSDNGPWFEGSAGSFRGRKGQAYEGGFRVPFVVSWPGNVLKDKVSKVPIMNLDIYPTLSFLAGVALPDDRMVDGKNIWGLLNGKTTTSPHEVLCYYHFDRLEGIRKGRWKYFDKTSRYVWPVPVDAPQLVDDMVKSHLGARWPLLYDLEIDAGESYNVINTHPDKAKELRELLLALEEQMKGNPRGFFE